MPLGRPPHDGDDSNTPPTRSYVDALLKGSMSDRELESLKAEIGSGTRGDDVDEARTAFHAYTPEESAAAARDPDEARTAFHTYTPEEREVDPDEARTAFHTYTPEDRRATRRSDMSLSAIAESVPEDRRATRRAPTPGVREEARSVFRSPTRNPPRPAPPVDDVDDDARTLMRPSPSAARSAPPTARSAPPAHSVPPVARSAPPTARSAPPAARSAPPAARSAPSARPAGFRAATSPPLRPTSSPPLDSLLGDLVDLGDLNTDPIPIPAVSAPTQPPSARSGPPSSEEIPLSAPSLRTYERKAIDESYLEALGGACGVPRLALSPAQLTGLPLGTQAGFLLSRIDGESNVEDLIDISGLPRLDTLRLLYELQQQGVIAVAKH